MQTRILPPTPANLREAADLLRAGEAIAFPTETVYGLGADAENPDAVARIYAAKGRPASNPLIVHIADREQARSLAEAWPPIAEDFASAFWPGPLTLVVKRSSRIPSIVTAGGSTVGLRVPAHPVALALLRWTAKPIAAPSANPANRISPTTAEHVLSGLAGRIPLILDGGSCAAGIESTVLDLTVDPPTILRPGIINLRDLCRIRPGISERVAEDSGPSRSPGRMPRHYSPRTPTILSCDRSMTRHLLTEQESQAVLAFGPFPEFEGWIYTQATDPESYARTLYAGLHALDAMNATRIIIELPPPGVEWSAIHDRLRRAGVAVSEHQIPSQQIGGFELPAIDADS